MTSGRSTPSLSITTSDGTFACVDNHCWLISRVPAGGFASRRHILIFIWQRRSQAPDLTRISACNPSQSRLDSDWRDLNATNGTSASCRRVACLAASRQR
uniref:Uncharacterized protein n=1 Tax=Plectus sambesii TaxID=2011161 RepID=A0A914UN12_9BILA